MIFLIQTVDNRIVHDFSFELINSIRYQREFRERYDIDYRECSLETLGMIIQYKKEYVPVGTVEFVQKYFNKFLDISLTPINIPKCLMDSKYSKRHVAIYNILKSYCPYTDNKKYFIKNHEMIKPKEFPKVDYISSIDDLKTYQISDVMDIKAEYRCIVHDNKLLDVRKYSGSFEYYPNIDYIYSLIEQYSHHNPPKAYTLDVGINDEVGTFIIEIHDFHSCGLYGYSDYNKLPFLFSQWYYNKIKNVA